MAKKILIVDDEEKIRKVLRIHLGKAGYEIIEADNGFDALKAMDEKLPDLVITDIMMPKLSGLELGSAIGYRQETRQIPLIVISAKTDPDTVLTAKKLNAAKFFAKPFEMASLLESVKKILGE